MPTFELTETAVDKWPMVNPTPDSPKISDPMDDLRAEIDGYYETIKGFPEQEPEDIMMYLSGMAARAAEVRGQLNRNDTRRSQAFRIKELDPFISAVEFQFKIWSRFQAIKEFDMRLQKGQI